jgi:Flp pilus assembly protein TadD
MLAGKTGEAARLADELLRLDRRSATSWIIRSAALQQDGRLAAGVTAAEKAVRLAPADNDAHFALAVALFRAGRFGQAAQRYEKALECAAKNAPSDAYRQIEILEALAEAHEAAGWPTEAQDARRRAAAIERRALAPFRASPRRR